MTHAPIPMTARPLATALALLALLAAPWALAATDGCAPGPVDPVDPGTLCAVVRNAPDDAPIGDAAVAVVSEARQTLGRLSLSRALAGADLVLAGALPDLAGHAALTPAADESLWPCPVRIDDVDARFAPVSVVASGGAATLVLASDRPEATPSVGLVSLVFLYADRAVRIDATCDEGPSALHVGFSLVPGWNVVASEVLAVDGEHVTFGLRDATAADAAQASWYWSDTPSGRTGPAPLVRPEEPPARR